MIKYKSEELEYEMVFVTAKIRSDYKRLLSQLGNNNVTRGINVLIRSNEKFIKKYIEKIEKSTKK